MKRKPTPAQIAARKRFAEMARSGAFKRKAKRNPAKKRSKPDPFVLAEIERANAHWAKTFGFSPDLIEMIGARTKFLEGQGLSYNDAFQQAVAEARTKTGPFAILKSNPVKTKRNPRASNPIILVSDKPIASKRKANPVKPKVPKYTVQTLISDKAKWKRVAMFDSLEQAKAYAEAVPRAYKVVAVRVIDDK